MNQIFDALQKVADKSDLVQSAIERAKVHIVGTREYEINQAWKERDLQRTHEILIAYAEHESLKPDPLVSHALSCSNVRQPRANFKPKTETKPIRHKRSELRNR